MKNHVKTFESFLDSQSEKLEEVTVSFKSFMKFIDSDILEKDSGIDVAIKFKEKIELKEASYEDIKSVVMNEDLWNEISSSDYNYFRKKNVYSYKEFLSLSKEKCKNKID